MVPKVTASNMSKEEQTNLQNGFADLVAKYEATQASLRQKQIDDIAMAKFKEYLEQKKRNEVSADKAEEGESSPSPPPPPPPGQAAVSVRNPFSPASRNYRLMRGTGGKTASTCP